MSVICITDHNENIYNIMKKATTYHLKSPRYKSKFSVKVRCEVEKSKDSHRDWGYAKYPLRAPENFLRKNSRKIPPKQSRCNAILDPFYGKKCLTNTKLPPVPLHTIAKGTVSKKSNIDSRLPNVGSNLSKKTTGQAGDFCECHLCTGICQYGKVCKHDSLKCVCPQKGGGSDFKSTEDTKPKKGDSGSMKTECQHCYGLCGYGKDCMHASDTCTCPKKYPPNSNKNNDAKCKCPRKGRNSDSSTAVECQHCYGLCGYGKACMHASDTCTCPKKYPPNSNKNNDAKCKCPRKGRNSDSSTEECQHCYGLCGYGKACMHASDTCTCPKKYPPNSNENNDAKCKCTRKGRNSDSSTVECQHCYGLCGYEKACMHASDACTCPRKYPPSSNPENQEIEHPNGNGKKVSSKKKLAGDNIVLRNIKEIMHSKARTPVPKYVDTKNGDTHMLNPSGLQPHYIYRKNYGKTPKYVLTLMNERERQLQIKRDELRRIQPECRYITREERDDLLEGLKQNWDELQKNYQGLPIQTDTIPKILRKSQMEAELKQLEKDIVLIERHPYIYVYNDK